MIQKIIFIYNADQGKLNAAFDSIHKFVSPGTYQCQLCAMTHGSFGMKKDWKAFIESLGVEIDFLHRDDVGEILGDTVPVLPVVMGIDEEKAMKVLVSAEEMKNMGNDPEKLKAAIREGVRSSSCGCDSE